MKIFKKIKSKITPLDLGNVDTDQIVPKQFLKLVTKTGYGKYLFYNWRFDSQENKISDFVLNNEKYLGSKILVAGENFGCGSSREHAVWALLDYGFSVIIASSFSDIFYSNCFKNGLLPIRVDTKIVEKIQNYTGEIEVDLEAQTIVIESESVKFEIESYQKKILLEGLDEITLTLEYENKINEFENNSTVPSIF